MSGEGSGSREGGMVGDSSYLSQWFRAGWIYYGGMMARAIMGHVEANMGQHFPSLVMLPNYKTYWLNCQVLMARISL